MTDWLKEFLESSNLQSVELVFKTNGLTSQDVMVQLKDEDIELLGLNIGDKIRMKSAIQTLRGPTIESQNDPFEK